MKTPAVIIDHNRLSICADRRLGSNTCLFCRQAKLPLDSAVPGVVHTIYLGDNIMRGTIKKAVRRSPCSHFQAFEARIVSVQYTYFRNFDCGILTRPDRAYAIHNVITYACINHLICRYSSRVPYAVVSYPTFSRGFVLPGLAVPISSPWDDMQISKGKA